MKLRNKKGFTLIELIVVIAVLAILITLAVPKYLDHVRSANTVALKADMRTVEQAYLQKAAKTGLTGATTGADLINAGYIKSLANTPAEFAVAADGTVTFDEDNSVSPNVNLATGADASDGLVASELE